MRSCSGRSSRDTTLALRFRIPHSAFRIRFTHSEFRIPHLFVGAAMLALLSTACQGDGRTPLIVYSPHGRDLLTLLERRFEQLHPDVDVRDRKSVV